MSEQGRSGRGRARWLVAVLAHAPGLWLMYREVLPRRLLVPSLLAVAATAVAMAAAYGLALPRWKVDATVATWAVMHIVWGIYLANRLARR